MFLSNHVENPTQPAEIQMFFMVLQKDTHRLSEWRLIDSYDYEMLYSEPISLKIHHALLKCMFFKNLHAHHPEE